MDMQGISRNYEQPLPLTGAAQKKEEPAKTEVPGDKVSIGERADDLPHIMVGVPTARLSPRIEQPNVHPSQIGIEITKGVGIGIDGESILVAPGKAGEIDIKGQPVPEASYPQRNYHVDRNENEAKVKGYYPWQNYDMTKTGTGSHIAGETDRETSDVVNTAQGFNISGKWPVQNFEVTFQGKETEVKGYDKVENAHLDTEGKTTTIKSEIEERNFKVTREDHHMKVEGRYKFQDFDITWDDQQIVVKGFYPQQTQIIKFSA